MMVGLGASDIPIRQWPSENVVKLATTIRVMEGIMVDQDDAESGGAKGCPRLLIIQTGTGMSAEAKVLYGLLSRLQAKNALDVLLFQGVGLSKSSPASETFAALPRVSLRRIPMGGLGSTVRGRTARAAKLMDVARLRLMRPSLITHAQSFRPTLVYSAQQQWDTAVADPLACALHIPYVIHLHYNVGPWLGETALRSLLRADAIVAVSDAVRDGAIQYGIAPDRIVTVYNSIAIPPSMSHQDREAARMRLRDELGIASSSIIVGMVARLSEWKGQSEALDAMLPLWPDHSNIHLVFAGGEDSTGIGLRSKLEARAREAGLSAHVHFLGPRSDVPALLDAMDIFVHPSRHDPCPLAVLEAMAHGLPVVAWREGGIAYQVDDERTGILVTPLDIAGLRAAIVRLVISPNLRVNMGIAARERATTIFTPERMTRSFQRIFARVAVAQAEVRTRG